MAEDLFFNFVAAVPARRPDVKHLLHGGGNRFVFVFAKNIWISSSLTEFVKLNWRKICGKMNHSLFEKVKIFLLLSDILFFGIINF